MSSHCFNANFCRALQQGKLAGSEVSQASDETSTLLQSTPLAALLSGQQAGPDSGEPSFQYATPLHLAAYFGHLKASYPLFSAHFVCF